MENVQDLWRRSSSSEKDEFKGMEAGNVAMIYGVTSQPAFNGQLCRVSLPYNEEDGRYIVKMIGINKKDEKKLKLKPGNLMYQPKGMRSHSVVGEKNH